MGIVRDAAGRAGCIMDEAAFGIKVQNRVDEGQGGLLAVNRCIMGQFRLLLP